MEISSQPVGCVPNFGDLDYFFAVCPKKKKQDKNFCQSFLLICHKTSKKLLVSRRCFYCKDYSSGQRNISGPSLAQAWMILSQITEIIFAPTGSTRGSLISNGINEPQRLSGDTSLQPAGVLHFNESF